ncbi:MAG: hypothetical protein A2X36_10170 [Elusimicrobia bacterium GWA2_69_24]|nr:MAG: hypothetical protein A2X36_10170 [Elusimicrobia bacterium GWA2_69_24]HBL19203.1 hypothetical protein [Elusimicrobiota bacterium]
MSEGAVELFVVEGKSAWRIRVPQPERFRGVRHDLRFRLFRVRGCALIGCWLRLFDIPDQPYFVHRVLDLSDPAVAGYMDRVLRQEAMVLVFESRGTEDGFSREIPVPEAELGAVLREASRGGKPKAGERASGGVEEFMSAFNPALRELKDVGKAWDAVERRFGRSRRKWFGLF